MDYFKLVTISRFFTIAGGLFAFTGAFGLYFFGKKVDLLKEQINDKKNRITYLANDVNSDAANSRNSLLELIQISEESTYSKNKKLADKHLNECSQTYISKYGNPSELDIHRIKNLKPDYIAGLEFIANQEALDLSNIVQHLNRVNTLWGTKFILKDFKEFQNWVEKKEFLKIVNQYKIE